MERTAADCSWEDLRVLSDDSLCAQLGPEAVDVLRATHDARYLDTLAKLSLSPKFTDQLFILYEPLIPELSARWCNCTSAEDVYDSIKVLAAFASILPVAPYLAPSLREFLTKCNTGYIGRLAKSSSLLLSNLNSEMLSTLLLAVFRLFSYDIAKFGNLISPVQLSSLLQHGDVSIRYLTVRCLALYMKLADALTENMISLHVREGLVSIEFDTFAVPSRLFSLREEQRWRSMTFRLQKTRNERRQSSTTAASSIPSNLLSPQTASLAGILLPRGTGIQESSWLVDTPTTNRNLAKVANALLWKNGILLAGPVGSGKTFLITESAKMLNQFQSMTTLHLNEQTDAKNLLGIYTTSPIDGSFVWEPGVLTKAMSEGRWVLVEDIHNAPPEIIGMLLTIIEHREILIPSRNQKVEAAAGFCVLATTNEITTNPDGITERLKIRLKLRLWNTVNVEPLQQAEVRVVLSTLFPMSQPFLGPFLDAHCRVQNLYGRNFEPQKSSSGQTRLLSLRDLFKWVSRSHSRLEAAGQRHGLGAVDEIVLNEILKDGVYLYAGHSAHLEQMTAVAQCIGGILQISPQRMRHCVFDDLPSLKEGGQSIRAGRAVCPLVTKHGVKRDTRKSKPTFALTRRSLKAIEEIATCVQYREPILLVGETGVGKTSLVQYLAGSIGQKLTVFNLSQQSEIGDLLGGLKPITMRSLLVPMSESFDTLFADTFSRHNNIHFLASTRKCFLKGNWTRLISLWQEAAANAKSVLRNATSSRIKPQETQPNKRRKLQSARYRVLHQRWEDFDRILSAHKASVSRGEKHVAFAFVEGKLVQALRNGEWVLLDEVNLATPDTLENISALLSTHHGRAPSLLLSDAGRIERVQGHSDFRIFATMNPATDVGKRDLSSGIRTLFTELFIQPSDTNVEDLSLLISTYLGGILDLDQLAAYDLAMCYLEVQSLTAERRLIDGAGQVPNFSTRSLVRTLLFASQNTPIYGLRRALYEGFLMSFATMLSVISERTVTELAKGHLFSRVKNARSLLNQGPKFSQEKESFILFRQHLVRTGRLDPEQQPNYIITPYVERNLLNLARAVSVRRFPVLLQGPTSSGKTSMVDYLAKISGNELVRVNNHEHTDLQEYLGSYASGKDGRLQYLDGVLVRALRRGHWIVLDELNLAPPDVLEALNRLLDDNRELFIPETQEMVKPHPNFALFATQNPAGLYGGRKHFSRAFRSRFLELHFDDIPDDELECILKERSQIAPSFCTRIVSVYKRLCVLRQSSRLFEQRNSFATLRDLFRWAGRQANDQYQLAINGYMLLAERVRDPVEKQDVKRIIEDVMKVKINEADMYSSYCGVFPEGISSVTLTPAMRRLLVLVTAAMENHEPVLLVGETGCGKTQVCQTVAAINGQNLHILNAHYNMETSDLIGTQRPARNKAEAEQNLRSSLESCLANITDEVASSRSLEELITEFERADLTNVESSLVASTSTHIAQIRSLFEWADGALVVAMKRGEPFLLDEISLAEDAVLERLNSVLEAGRSIFLAEKGADDSSVNASPGFQFLATMNPGGDYGKRELSSALRNRLTEIWVPPLSAETDILPILQAHLGNELEAMAKIMIEFAAWFRDSFHALEQSPTSLRDLLTWTDFVRASRHQDKIIPVIHGAALVFIDSLGANPAGLRSIHAADVWRARRSCHSKLGELLRQDLPSAFFQAPAVMVDGEYVRCGEFDIFRGGHGRSQTRLAFDAPTTKTNALRIFRGLQLSKPILLEGDPGAGKTALVEAIAHIAQKSLTRINLSDQTDLMDLFGSDVPVEGKSAGNFGWRDGPLLRAMQNGDWVLLDEMNLATQSVLEGLNSCFDHRKEVYVTELDQTFVRHPNFVLFATQNPHHQGGGRKGLPNSFINRFTVVYAEALTKEDLTVICGRRYGELSHHVIENVISTFSKCRDLVQNERVFVSAGGPWEINLRDIFRWLDLYAHHNSHVSPIYVYDVILSQRFRTPDQRRAIKNTYDPSTSDRSNLDTFNTVSTSSYHIGSARLLRDLYYQYMKGNDLDLSPELLPYAQSLIHCINEKWPAVIVGKSGSGKSTLIRKLASLSGRALLNFSVTEDIDAADLIGGFEQYHHGRAMSDLIASLREKCIANLTHEILTMKQTLNFDSLLAVLESCDSADYEVNIVEAAIARLDPAFPEMAAMGSELATLMRQQSRRQEARFRWVDGVLVEAVTKGYWLVLDNANACDPAILDRLNALLEPGGQLVISEQHESNGSPRFVQAHNDFRIFLTMDPSRGELSRAMRNRSVEIHLKSGSSKWPVLCPMTYPTEAGVSNFRRLATIPYDQYETSIRQDLADVAIDHLPIRDLLSVAPEDFGSILDLDHQVIVDEVIHYRSLPAPLFQAILGFYQTIVARKSVLAHSSESWPLHPEFGRSKVLWNDSDEVQVTASRLGWLLESFTALNRTQRLLSSAEINAAKFSIRQMNVLEQSVAEVRLPHQGEDSFWPIAELIRSIRCCAYEALLILLTGHSTSDWWPADELNSLLAYLHDMIDISKATCVQADSLAIYVEIGENVALKFHSCFPKLVQPFQKSLANLGKKVKLRGGQSLSRLWRHWRPKSAATIDQLELFSRLDRLISTLDCHNKKVRIIPELLRIRKSLLATRDKILEGSDNVAALLKELQTIVSEVETDAPKKNATLTYFAVAFESLCQYHDLKDWMSTELPCLSHSQESGRDSLLAGRQMRTLAFQTTSELGPAKLARMAAVAGYHNIHIKSRVWEGNFVQDLLLKLEDCSNNPICSLDDLTEELAWLSTSISKETRSLCEDSVHKIGQGVYALVKDVLWCHRDLLKCEFQPPASESADTLSTFAQKLDQFGDGDIFLDHVQHDHYIREIWVLYLLPALRLRDAQPDVNNLRRVGASLVSLAMASLRLWIPDRPSDPSLELTVQRARYTRQKREFTSKFEAFKIFEESFFGRGTSLRIVRAKQDISQTGCEPPSSPVYRSSNDNLAQVHAVFSSILDSIVGKRPEKILLSLVAGPFQDDRISPPERAKEIELLRQNLEKLIGRLAQSPMDYMDLSFPAMQLLQILDLGASMLGCSERGQGAEELRTSLSYISNSIPLLGATPLSMAQFVTGQSCSTNAPIESIVYLNAINLMLMFSWPDILASRLRSKASAVFEVCYVYWRERLRAGQHEEAQRAKYYEYRGEPIEDDEDDLKEMEILFPGPTEGSKTEEKGKPVKSYDYKTFAVQIASLHESMVSLERTEPAFSHSLRESAHSLASLLPADNQEAVISPMIMLPALFLLLEEKGHFFKGRATRATPNIYKDSDVKEARKLLSLIVQIKTRVQQIHRSWPDHAVPIDILKCCSETGCVSISAPVAHLLSKAETLHGALNEWQNFASREFSVAPFITELTSLIISWRRLELSSWSTLLHEEDTKHDHEAKSWWFVLYEAIISIPSSLLRDEEYWESHAKELVSTLTRFLQTSSLGQFGYRMRVLRSFDRLLHTTRSRSPLKTVKPALSNVIEFFERFEPAVRKSLVEGKERLTKEVKQQIKLASWKDTNVNSLRESARRSHCRLTRIVKKYRSFLGEGIQTFTAPELDLRRIEPPPVTSSEQSAGSINLLSALDKVEQHVEGWQNVPRRLREPLGASANMIKLYSSSGGSIDVGSELQQYVRTLTSTMAELRSQTPSKLDQDTRHILAYLKARKRRLLAGVLSNVRHMGIRRNLNVQELEKQRSLESVLTSIPEVLKEGGQVTENNIDQYISNAGRQFQRFLDFMDRARCSQESHTDDLTGPEVGRCVGSLEGLLLVMQKQRSMLQRCLAQLAALFYASRMVDNLRINSQDLLILDYLTCQKQEQTKLVISSLAQILPTACDILAIQARHGSMDFAVVITGLSSYQLQFKDAETNLANSIARKYPPLVQSRELFEKYASWQSLIASLQEDLEKWIADEPDAAYLTSQLLPWTDWSPVSTHDDFSGENTGLDFKVVQGKILAAIDRIFISIQSQNEAARRLPDNVEDREWFSRSDQGLFASIMSLHMDQITNDLEDVLGLLSRLNVADFETAISLLGVFNPVIQQFYSICSHAVARYADLHSETCRLSGLLIKSFAQLASEGFCGPSEGTTDGEENTGQLEPGTGLGEGEGTEDISKDIADDEDLSELAQQQPAKDIKGDIENEDNAVDIGTDDLLGSMDEDGQVADEDDNGQDPRSEGSDDDLEEQTGRVDNLDPSTVDEKLWDGLADDREKDLENEGKSGKSPKDKAAAQENKGGDRDEGIEGDSGEAEDGASTEIGDDSHHPQAEKADPHLQEEEALELPADMQLDGNLTYEESASDDEGLDQLSDVSSEEKLQNTQDIENIDYEDGDSEGGDDRHSEKDKGNDPANSETNGMDIDVDDEMRSCEEDGQCEGQEYQTRPEEDYQVAEGKVDAEIGVSGEAADSTKLEATEGSSQPPAQSPLATSQDREDILGGSQDGALNKVSEETGEGSQQAMDRQTETFKKLGDVLEKWHRRQREILQLSEISKPGGELNVADADFEHVRDEEDPGAAQALGVATTEQAQPLDEKMAVEDSNKQEYDILPPEPTEEHDDVRALESEEARRGSDEDYSAQQGVEYGSFIAERSQDASSKQQTSGVGEGEEFEDVDNHISSIDSPNVDQTTLISPTEALRLWSHYSAITQPLSLVLTEQLRLILSPTQATKLRGDFRTGKRLNLKRIIPYIASEYRRDKIWMRRSVPSKRNYQIMIAVDDSRSMTEGGAHALALKTLALLCKSLSLLEVGEFCVVGFGDEEHVRMAHEFATPFTNNSGPSLYQHFSFHQRGTNVRRLIQESIQLFRHARARGSRSSGSSSADLWQLQLIISDGICEEHDVIQRLVRQATQERIMIVFVIVDSNAARGNSILDLSQAVFEPDKAAVPAPAATAVVAGFGSAGDGVNEAGEGGGGGGGEMKLKMQKYLDGFPFPYYVVVREIGDLPGVLATALKGWFREVVDVS